MTTVSSAPPESTFAETADLVACLVIAQGSQCLHVDGLYGLRALLAMEPLTVHAALALALLRDTRQAVALSLAGQWDLPEDVANPVRRFVVEALPQALATAEAAMAHARQRLDEVLDYRSISACGHLLAVMDAVDRNLWAGRELAFGTASPTGLPTDQQACYRPVGKARQGAALRALAVVYTTMNASPGPEHGQADEQTGQGMNALLDLAAMHGLSARQIREAAAEWR